MKSRKITLTNLSAGQQWRCRHREKTYRHTGVGRKQSVGPIERIALKHISGYVWIWELDCEESWAPKNWCFWTVVLEKMLESPLDCKEIQLVHPKGDQSWRVIARTDAETETPILWPPDAKNWLIGKNPNAGKDWRQEEKGITKDEMVGWNHRLNGHDFE